MICCLRHTLRGGSFSPAVSSYSRWSSQYGPQHRVPLLHRGAQHTHTHREQQQLQRDVSLHAGPEGGADTGQQTGCLMSWCAHTHQQVFSKTLKPSFLKDQLCISPVLTDLVYTHVCLFFCLLNILMLCICNHDRAECNSAFPFYVSSCNGKLASLNEMRVLCFNEE